MTVEELQYEFETKHTDVLGRMDTCYVMAFVLHMTRVIPAHEWVPKDWLTCCGILNQYKKSRSVTEPQKWYVINTILRTLPAGVAYMNTSLQQTLLIDTMVKDIV